MELLILLGRLEALKCLIDHGDTLAASIGSKSVDPGFELYQYAGFFMDAEKKLVVQNQFRSYFEAHLL